MRPSLYEFAGGQAALLALASAHHERCLQDPELSHPFSHPGQHPQHTQRLAAYWAQVLGGPETFSSEYGSHAAVVRMHCGNGDMSDLNRRFVVSFERAMDDAGLPDDAEFRTAMGDYMRWAVGEVSGREDAGRDPALGGPDDIADDAPMPRWSWDGLQAGAGV